MLTKAIPDGLGQIGRLWGDHVLTAAVIAGALFAASLVLGLDTAPFASPYV